MIGLGWACDLAWACLGFAWGWAWLVMACRLPCLALALGLGLGLGLAGCLSWGLAWLALVGLPWLVAGLGWLAGCLAGLAWQEPDISGSTYRGKLHFHVSHESRWSLRPICFSHNCWHIDEVIYDNTHAHSLPGSSDGSSLFHMLCVWSSIVS